MSQISPSGQVLPGFAMALLALTLSACAATAPGSPAPAATSAHARLDPAFEGVWQLDPTHSTSIDPWLHLTVAITRSDDAVTVVRRWTGSREGGASTDSVRFVPGGRAVTVRMDQWADNRHLGAFLTADSSKTVTGRVDDDGATLVTESHVRLIVQQGEIPVRTYTEYRISPGGTRLDVLELRSTRPLPIHYVFDRVQPGS